MTGRRRLYRAAVVELRIGVGSFIEKDEADPAGCDSRVHGVPAA